MNTLVCLSIPGADLPQWLWVSVGWLLHLVVVIAVTIHALSRRREASSTILWIFVSWSFPVVGALAYLLFGVDRVADKGFRKYSTNEQLLSERQRREREAQPLAYWGRMREGSIVQPDDPFDRELNHALQAVLPDHPLLGHNRIDPLAGGAEAFPRMMEAIERAEHHIHLQSFIINDDPVGRRFRDALEAKAAEGVQVRLLYDRFGCSHAVWRGFFRRFRHLPCLQIAGWTQANPLKSQFQINLRNHRKILVVDGHTAFTGGVNLQAGNEETDPARAIRDYHFALQGPLVTELQYTFMRDWYFITGEDPGRLLDGVYFPDPGHTGNSSARVVNGGPVPSGRTLGEAFYLALTHARDSILAVTPYFVPPSPLVAALRAASFRGVSVRLVLPEVNNHVYAGLAARAMYEDMLDAGVRILHRRPPFLHAKALVVDDRFALVGSANLDVRSLRLNYETNLAVFDEDFVDRLKAILVADIAASEPVDPDQWRRRPAHRRMLENFAYLLKPVL